MLLEKAKRIAEILHKGQLRNDRVTPYITHPEAVYNLLKEIGIEEEDTLCSAWLHDTIEDCGITKEEIESEFNQNIARIVQMLTRNEGREEYKKRIENADYPVQIIKLADMVHNCATLSSNLPEETIRRKVEEGISFYIPLAEKVCPKFSSMLVKHLQPWLNIKQQDL